MTKRSCVRIDSSVTFLLSLPMFFRSPVLRLVQTQRQFVRVIPEAITKPSTKPTMSDAPEPTGLIANKGLELLTFSTPNGVRRAKVEKNWGSC